MSEWNGDCPAGWELVTIGDVVVPKVEQGAPSTDFTYIDIGSVNNKTKQIDSAKALIAGNNVPSRAQQHVQAADILVSMTRPNLNAVAKVPTELDGAICSTGFDVLRPIEVEPDWLFLTVKSRPFVEAMTSLVQGALYPAVRPSEVRAYKVGLPPLAEQRRIAAKIEALQERSRRVREALSEVAPLLEQFRQSVLAAAFRGDLTADWRAAHPNVEPASELFQPIRAEGRRRWEQAELAKYEAKGQKPPKNWQNKYEEPESVDDSELPELPVGWAWCQLGLLGDDPLNTVQTGPFGAQLHRTEFTTEGVPVIAVGNLTGIGFTKKGLYFITEKKANQLRRYDVQAGDLLFARSGATLGKVCIAPSYVNDWRMTGHILRARLNRAFVLPEIVAFALWGDPAVKSNVRLRIRGMTRPGYNTSLLQSVPIPLPPLEEQRELVALVSQVFSGVDDIASFIQASLTPALDQLDQAILAKAFRGELVPHDPNDEPASVLLERIRAQRKQQAEPAKRMSKPHQTSKLGKKSPKLEPQQLTLTEVLRTGD